MSIPAGYRDHWEELSLAPYLGWPPALEFARTQYGLDPAKMPLDSFLRLDYRARTVTTEYYEFDGDGRLLKRGNEAARTEVVQRMESPPAMWPFCPADVLKWRREQRWYPAKGVAGDDDR